MGEVDQDKAVDLYNMGEVDQDKLLEDQDENLNQKYGFQKRYWDAKFLLEKYHLLKKLSKQV
jgi:hypothetical protein